MTLLRRQDLCLKFEESIVIGSLGLGLPDGVSLSAANRIRIHGLRSHPDVNLFENYSTNKYLPLTMTNRNSNH
ncbi:hypothetical protein PN498_06410 [Oscillatoria sp. CS-180]|uniref:hypothetical protein n=1 Tax=Oscillatoria sp. CS-180 TaxID=3021720 RepID=UPI00232DE1D3|nr:hypothetical protein [Oscillatoria sp. CS-180]MDB9525613.1 hypothetical protein [Oscillatoria sp. CS-180]